LLLGLKMSVENKKVFIGRIRYKSIARIGRIKGAVYGGETETKNKS